MRALIGAGLLRHLLAKHACRGLRLLDTDRKVLSVVSLGARWVSPPENIDASARFCNRPQGNDYPSICVLARPLRFGRKRPCGFSFQWFANRRELLVPSLVDPNKYIENLGRTAQLYYLPQFARNTANFIQQFADMV
jgi:hypothetical protein